MEPAASQRRSRRPATSASPREAWATNPVAAFSAAIYLLNARTLLGLAEAVRGRRQDQGAAALRGRAMDGGRGAQQLPARSTPRRRRRRIETKGESIAKGMQNLLQDIQQGHVSQTDESVFEVGRNVATTEGAVVFENDLFQLIEYKPLTAKVYERPLLVVPPCINKFYILDLQPENSLVRYAVEQGHRTFVVSWRNPDESLARTRPGTTTSTTARIKAIDVVQEITGAKTDQRAGLLRRRHHPRHGAGGAGGARREAGGLADAADDLARLHRHRRARPLHRRGLRCKFREMQIGPAAACCKGQELASTFSFLRPNDLVWNYVVGNYLKGETPPPFDLLYWNSDSHQPAGPDVLPGTCATPTSRTTCVKPGKLHRVRREGRPAARSTCRSTSTARARTTSCRSDGAYASTAACCRARSAS